MNMHMIATIYNGQNRVGFRLLNYEAKQTVDMPEVTVTEAVKSGISIQNIEYVDDKLKGTNGDISRYPQLNENGTLKANNPIIVLFQVEDSNKYVVCNYAGIIALVNEDVVVNYAKKNGIANGKLVTKGEDSYISAIFGSYAKIKHPKSEVKIPSLTNKTLEDFTEYCQMNNIGDYSSVLDNCLAIEEAIKNKEEKAKYKNKTKLLYEIIAALDTGDNIVKVFGKDIGLFIIKFISEDIPFPVMLVKECSRLASDNEEILIHTLFPYFNDTVNGIFKYEDTTLYMIAKQYIRKLILVEMLGEYSEHPPEKFISVNNMISRFVLCHDYSFIELKALVGTINLLEEFQGDINSLRDVVPNTSMLYELAILYVNTELPRFNTILLEEKEALLTAIAYKREFFSTDKNVYGTYQVDKIKGKILDKTLFKGHDDCIFVNIPERKGKDKMSEFETDIKDVYEKQLIALEIGTDSVVGRFRNYCEHMIKLYNATKSLESSKPKTATSGEAVSLAGKSKEQAYKILRIRIPKSEINISIEISDNMMNRDLAYKEMTKRQKYRFDEALKGLLEKFSPQDIENFYPSSDKPSKPVLDDNGEQVNNSYLIDEHKDIQYKINRLMEKQDSVEMKEVLKSEPLVLKICYSVLRFKKATDKQLKHIDNAIEILDMQ